MLIIRDGNHLPERQVAVRSGHRSKQSRRENGKTCLVNGRKQLGSPPSSFSQLGFVGHCTKEPGLIHYCPLLTVLTVLTEGAPDPTRIAWTQTIGRNQPRRLFKISKHIVIKTQYCLGGLDRVPFVPRAALLSCDSDDSFRKFSQRTSWRWDMGSAEPVTRYKVKPDGTKIRSSIE